MCACAPLHVCMCVCAFGCFKKYKFSREVHALTAVAGNWSPPQHAIALPSSTHTGMYIQYERYNN